MRILHLYAGNLYGGVETFLLTLARERSLSTMQPTFGLCFEGRLSQELRAEGVAVEMLGEVRFSRPWTVWAARRNLHQLLGREKFDVVICHSAWPHALFAAVVKREDLPLAYWAHNPPEDHWITRRAGGTPPDLVVANSEYTRSHHQVLFDTTNNVVVRCAVPKPRVADHEMLRQEIRGEFQTPPDDVVIVCSCRLEAWKGHRLLLESLGKLRDLPNWSAWIAGGAQRESEREYLSHLQAQALSENIDSRVKFIGQRNDVPRVLCGADIHCQPNTGPEPFGIAFIEALYAGLPVVTTNLGAAPEIVTEECGVLVAPNASDVASALRDLIQDPERRARLSASAPARAATLCDPSTVLPKIDIELSRIIQPANSS